jgi:ParB-like chromosome segregation protein Spo0J
MKTNPADKVQQWAIERLTPYARNARTHSDAQVAQLAASIREWGWTTPILVSPDGGVIAGHGRLLAARQLGMVNVPVIVAEGWSEAKTRTYVLADNQLALQAGWDNELLALELGELGELGFDLDMTGFGEDEIAALTPGGTEGLTDPDEVPEPPAEPITKAGDLWLLGEHRVLCGDSTKAEDVARLMGGEKAKSVVTDPPYGIGPLMQGGTWAKKAAAHLSAMREWDATTSQQFFDMVVSLGVPSVVWGGNYFITPASRCWLAWDKPEFPTMSSVELAWTNIDKNAKRIECPRTHQADGAKEHATQKPVRVMAWALEFVPAGLVYDPFLGSGTTLIAAEQLGRKCYGMEISPAYCDVIVKRWEQFTGKQATRESARVP